MFVSMKLSMRPFQGKGSSSTIRGPIFPNQIQWENDLFKSSLLGYYIIRRMKAVVLIIYLVSAKVERRHYINEWGQVKLKQHPDVNNVRYHSTHLELARS